MIHLKNIWIVLTVLILFGSALRFVGWQERSLWQDEVLTLSLATGNPLFEATLKPDDFHLDPPGPKPPAYYRGTAQTLQSWNAFFAGIRHNVQMPLYPLLIRLWAMALDDDPVGMRVFSMIAGILCIPAGFLLGKALWDDRLGLLNASVIALSGFQLIYSQTARLYALLMLLTLVSSWLMVGLIRGYPRQRLLWAGLFCTSLLGIYCHYFYLFVISFQGATLWLFSNKEGQNPYYSRQLLLFYLCLGLCLLPWLPILQEQMAFLKAIGHGNLQGLWDPVALIERLWSNLLSMVSPKSTPVKVISFFCILAGLVLLARRKELPKTPWVVAGIWLLFTVGGLILVDVLSGTHRIMSNRYLIPASPALYLLISCGLLSLPKRWGIVLGSVLLLFMGLNTVEVLSGGKFLKKEDYRGAGQYITAHHQPGDSVIISHSGVHAAGVAFYLPEDVLVSGIGRHNPGVAWTDEDLEKKLRAATKRQKQVWLVLTHVKPPALKERLHARLKRTFRQKSTQRVNGIEIYQYVRQP